jgi:hypothetical protein
MSDLTAGFLARWVASTPGRPRHMMISRRAPESAIVVFVALAAVTAALTLVAIERSPLVWSDETYIA